MTSTNTNPFDRPVWASLAYAPLLAEGGDQARRYRRDVNLFASARDDGTVVRPQAIAAGATGS